MEIVFWLSFLAGLTTIIDIFRRPVHTWEHIDRDRGHWKLLSILLTLFGLGLFVGIAYVIIVLPRLGLSSHSSVRDLSRNDFRR